MCCFRSQILWQFQRNNVPFYGETLERQLPEIQIVIGETVTFVWAEGATISAPHLDRLAPAGYSGISYRRSRVPTPVCMRARGCVCVGGEDASCMAW